MHRSSGIHWTRLAACMSLLWLFAGCGSGKKTFVVYSWPKGASIYVDEELRGQTNQSVTVDFGVRSHRTIRVEMEGRQPAGALVTTSSPEALSFVLEFAPR
jgi:hypothetical protein